MLFIQFMFHLGVWGSLQDNGPRFGLLGLWLLKVSCSRSLFFYASTSPHNTTVLIFIKPLRVVPKVLDNSFF